MYDACDFFSLKPSHSWLGGFPNCFHEEDIYIYILDLRTARTGCQSLINKGVYVGIPEPGFNMLRVIGGG